ncbi:hypothetical protein E7744_03655 [Citricoccus sp. SGAir0253]|uniref:hypothetical protein n=1 Tax=Citricoccus sp. SGAir0253 TaxID=2567881 RepID=UPI0010CD08A0|nr:hypothetical protein [Citricoccus sp. SGAir0253]QCU77412.1 hypothetical protein E7744_03655 [Citricoccus sp. SGAir0253]
MLYLITPDGTVHWTDTELGYALADAKAGRRQLADLDWREDPGTVPAETVLALALRHGIDARTGLVLHGGFVEQAREPDRLRAAAQEQRLVTRQLESIAEEPRFEDRNWFRRQRAVAEEARQDAGTALRTADKAARELFEDPVQDHLVRAWQRAGGLVPATA